MHPSENGEKSDRDSKGRFIEGNPGGPGRPQGSISIKERVRQYLTDHPEKLDEFVKYFAEENRDLAWQMLEGRPRQQMELDGEFRTYEIIRGDEHPDRPVQESTSSVAQESTSAVESQSV